MDDTHTMIVDIVWKEAYQRLVYATQVPGGSTRQYNYLPNTTDWLGRWRLAGNNSNDHLIDREVQRTKSFSGIDGIQPQDQAVQESMGEIVDRSFEHLAGSDIMIARVRRLLLRAARGMAEGKVPPGAADPLCLDAVRGGHFVAKEGIDWLQALADQRAAAPMPKMAAE